MKRLVVLFFVVICSATVTMGQSACAQLGVNCSHPTTPQGGNSSHGSSSSGSNGDSNSGSSYYDIAKEHDRLGFVYYNSWKQSHSQSDYQNALNEFEAAWKADKWGGVGMVEMLDDAGDSRNSLIWAEAAKHTKYKNTHWVHTWLDYIIATDKVDIANDDYNNKCTLHTAPSGNGAAVDPSASVMGQIKECKKMLANIGEQKKKAESAGSAFRKLQQ
jgi:hypothetical protein